MEQFSAISALSCLKASSTLQADLLVLYPRIAPFKLPTVVGNIETLPR
jgi:hypothetical protein